MSFVTMPAMRLGTSTARRAVRSSLPALLLCGLFAGQALADCNAEIGALSKKRQDLIDELNKAAKSAPKGQLDPAVSCPKLKALAGAEQALLVYLEKNKDWCVVPDTAISNFKTGAERSKAIAAKACTVAEQIKKGLEAGAAQAQKLPAGPL